MMFAFRDCEISRAVGVEPDTSQMHITNVTGSDKLIGDQAPQNEPFFVCSLT
jgi:hypothetical protein